MANNKPKAVVKEGVAFASSCSVDWYASCAAVLLATANIARHDHWYVSGHNAGSLHELLGQVYQSCYDALDALTEHAIVLCDDCPRPLLDPLSMQVIAADVTATLVGAVAPGYCALNSLAACLSTLAYWQPLACKSTDGPIGPLVLNNVFADVCTKLNVLLYKLQAQV